MNNKKQQLEFAQLVLAALQGDISEEQSRALAHTLNTNPEALSLYIHLMEIYTELSPMGSVRIPVVSEPRPDSPVENFNDLMKTLAAEEETAPVLVVPKPAESKPNLNAAEQTTAERKTGKFNFWTTFVPLAALLLMIACLQILPYFEPVPVATVKDSIRADYGDDIFPIGSRLTNRKDLYSLQKGVVKIEFDSGASVVIEAPAEFRLSSINKMILRSGRLFAAVPMPATGFTVDTPDSTVVDLGTEFGVDAIAQQGTELHVFSGKTELAVTGTDKQKRVQDVTTGQAKQVNAANGQVRSIPFEKYRFVRRIDSKANLVWKGRDVISLTDLVSGGNGYGISLESSVNYAVDSGEKTPSWGHQYRVGADSYQQISSNPFIDGVFVPKAKNQVVSSEGHVFADCPDTSGFYFMELCFNKKWKYTALAAQRYEKMRDLTFEPSILYMHSNLGATFNLDAVRRQFPGQSVCRFLTTVGTLSSFGGYPIYQSEETFLPVETEFDVWFVVDGSLRMKAQQVRSDSLLNLEVPISPEDRFLSILVTDGRVNRSLGNSANHMDLCGLADPRFEMELKE